MHRIAVRHGSCKQRMRNAEAALVRMFSLIGCLSVAFCAVSAPAFGEWQPRGVVPTKAVLRDVLAANARASGRESARIAQRRERWTYANGSRRIAVTVAVRDDDFRTSLELDGLTYMAGRRAGLRWRGDGNGIVHGIRADLQGDALDRAPQALFRLDPAACTLVGEAPFSAPAWVIKTDAAGDKPAFLYIDEATGSIVREVMREGRRTVTTSFDRFEALDGALRARHWHVDDTNLSDTLDVTVDAIEPGVVTAADVAFPERRVFAPVTPLETSVDLSAAFHGGEVDVEIRLDGIRRHFLLDTGTASITVDPGLARRAGAPTLEHMILSHVEVGPLQLDRVSALTVPFRNDGILGLDFFFGHVVEIDYVRRRVRVLSAGDAQAVFADPQTAVLKANVDQGLPLVTAAFGSAQSDQFAIDTGSPRVYVMRPFTSRFAPEIAAHWTLAGPAYVTRYLEGGIEVQPYRVSSFQLANARAQNLIVGIQLPTKLTDDLAIPFDGIIGTDILRSFDLYFDYDNGRLGLRY